MNLVLFKKLYDQAHLFDRLSGFLRRGDLDLDFLRIFSLRSELRRLFLTAFLLEAALFSGDFFTCLLLLWPLSALEPEEEPAEGDLHLRCLLRFLGGVG